MSPRIQAIVTQFVEDLTAAIQEEGAAAFRAAIGSGAAPAGRRRAPSTPSARPSAARRTKGAKRSPEELEALTKNLLAAIKKNPGQRIEQIGKSIGTPTKELALPVKKLFAEKKISTKGQRRATAYFAR